MKLRTNSSHDNHEEEKQREIKRSWERTLVDSKK